MLLLNSDNLGEQALNKLATLALQSQFRTAQQLDVRVKTEPALLARGCLASLTVDGFGLVLPSNAKLQALQLHLENITVNPFKALMGSIELTEPTEGSACLVLSEADCALALSDSLAGEAIRCRCEADGTLVVTLESCRPESIGFRTRPHFCAQRDRAVCEVLDRSAALPADLVARLERCLNLEDFILPGLSLQPRQLHVETGCIAIQARARLTHFPTAA